MNLNRTIPLKTFLATITISTLLIAGLLFSLSQAAYVGDVQESWFTLPLQEHSYIVGEYNSTHYFMRNATGEGSDANEGYAWLSTNHTEVYEACMGNLSSGTIYLRELQWNTSITVVSNVMVFEQYQGELHYFTSAGSGKVGDCPVQTYDSFTLQNNTNEQTLLEITPTVIVKLYSLYIDLSNLTQVCTIRVYNKIDNSSYTEIPGMALTDLDSDNRKGLALKELMINTDLKISIQSSTAEATNRSIAYRYFTESW